MPPLVVVFATIGWGVCRGVFHRLLHLGVEDLDLGRLAQAHHNFLCLLLQKLGEEARVSLTDFSLSGGSAKTLRQAHNKIEKHKLHFEVWPVGADPFKVRILTTVYHDGGYKTIRASAWNYEVKQPTVRFAEDLLRVYDLLEARLTQHGPDVVRALLERLS